ncbi:MAG TPA: NB-ARC domain-containing protein, partial [Candidatus Limnocylindrales bacterium]|nr:NB-ARC domain-containing protein [Candidatus Limnocylindrales bacterium]
MPGVASVFPPLRSIDARPNNLPADVTSFVGRVAEITAVRELLARHRLVTLTGPGGTGKTRLGRRVAWEALGEFDDGAWFVDLSPIVDAGLVASAIGQVLEVREQPDRSLVDALKAHLADRRTLFVLDNLEQVTAAGPLVADLLASASGLRVLATSRVPLHIYGEQEYPVLPLAVPHVDPDAPVDIASVVESEAVRLFIERARAARPDLRLDADDARAVAEICARLDGLPLAIELAAARVKLLPPRALLERLDHRLTLLASTSVDLPPRQRTLRGAIDWSYDLLDEPDRELFARLAVFRGGFTLGTAESVAAGAIDGRPALEVMAGIESLLDKSLLRASQTDHAGEVRIAMLETIREYALERLAASGAEDAIRRRHAETFRALAEEAEPHLTGADLALWLDRLTHEHDDIRAALSWAIETGEAATGLRIGYAVWRFWQQRGHLREGRDWLSRLVGLAGAATEPAAKGRALIALGGLAYWQHDYDAAGAAFDESRRLGESVQDASLVAEAAYNQAWIHAVRGENDEALQGWRESQDLYRALGDELSVARAAQYIGLGAFVMGDMTSARAAFEEEISYFERPGRKYELGDAYVGIAETYQREGRLAEAWRNYDRGLSVFAEAGNLTGIAMAVQGEASVAAAAGQVEVAVRLGAAADRLEER